MDSGAEENFGYAGAMSGFIGAMIAVSLIEIPAMHLILPWKWAQVAAWVLGVVGIIMLLRLRAGLRGNPHVIGPEGLRVRFGSSLDITLPWSAVASVTHRLRAIEGRDIGVDEDEEGRVLRVGISNQTNVEIALHEPTTITLRKGRTDTVSEVRLYADQASALVASARSRIDATA